MQLIEQHRRAVILDTFKAYRFPDAAQIEYAETFLRVPLPTEDWLTVEETEQYLAPLTPLEDWTDLPPMSPAEIMREFGLFTVEDHRAK